MTTNDPTPEPAPEPIPPVYDCRRGGRQHKVITADTICVLCGARGVVDASKLPPRPLHPAADNAHPSPLL